MLLEQAHQVDKPLSNNQAEIDHYLDKNLYDQLEIEYQNLCLYEYYQRIFF
jgi:hypothetical protein